MLAIWRGTSSVFCNTLLVPRRPRAWRVKTTSPFPYDRRMTSRQTNLLLSCIAAALLLPASARAADSSAAAERAGEEPRPTLADRFWKLRSDLSPSEAAELPEYCEGVYRLPVARYSGSIRDADYPIEAEARTVEYWDSGEVTLRGDVQIQQGNRRLRAPIAHLNHATREGSADGGVLVEQTDILFAGERAQLNMDSQKLDLQEVDFLLVGPEFRGSAAEVRRGEDGALTITQGTFTRCEPGNRNWRVHATSLVIEEGDIFGTARNAVLRVRGVPVFYTPYLSFPVSDERKSGFLFPGLGYSDEDGIDVTLPYYFNIAPNFDATLIPRFLGERGAGAEAELRHLSSWEESTLSGAFLPEDDLFNGDISRDDFDELQAAGLVNGEFEPADRWLYALDHFGRFGKFSTIVDYTAVSDRDYFRDLGTDLSVSSRIELERRGELRYRNGGLYMRLWAQRFQRLDANRVDPYQRLPELFLSYRGKDLGALQWSLDTSYVSFDRDNDVLVGINRIVGDRLHIEPHVRLPFSRTWGFATLAGGFRYTQYDLRDTPIGVDEKPEREIGYASLDAGLFFERDLNWFGTPLVQTLEPRMFYFYQEFEDQSALPRFDTTELTFSYNQLYRDNRFAGLDRIGDADQLSVGLTTRFIGGTSGREYFRASIGEIVYFDDRQVTLTGLPDADDRHGTSALAGELATTIGRWRLTGSVIWDPHDDEVDEGGGHLQYRGDNNHIFNIGYRNRRRDEIEQTDFSLKWPISRHYSLLGRWNYDLVSGRTIEGMAGIEYNDCCWRMRLIARHYLESPSGRQFADVEADDGIFFQIVFKGLAGVGTKLESMLQDSIRGYRTTD